MAPLLLRYLAIALCTVVALGHAGAQIVNVQGQLAKPPSTDGVSGQVELKLDLRRGNNELSQIGGSGAVLLRRGPLLALALARGEYGESRGITLSEKTFEHLRARYTIDCRWRWEAFAQHEYDAFRRLSLRALAGTGPAVQLVDTKDLGVLAGAAYMLEFEQLDRRTGTLDAGDRTVSSRASFYLTGAEKLGAGVSIVQTVYLQPRIGDPGDLRVLAEASVTTQLSSRIALTDGVVLAYDRTPPDGVQRTDLALTLGVLVKF